jgi:hypothetical protein
LRSQAGFSITVASFEACVVSTIVVDRKVEIDRIAHRG